MNPLSPNDQIVALFIALCEHESPGDRELFFLEHPLVASQRALEVLGPDGGNVAPPSAAFPGRARQAWGQLQHFVEAVRRVPRSYPLGAGPIERLWTKVRHGELRRDLACTMATSDSLTALLSAEYVTGLGANAAQLAKEAALEAALLIFDLLRLAVRATSGPESLDLRIRVEIEWLTAADAILVQVADGHVYADACATAQWLIETAAERGDLPLLTRSEHGLGVIHLDPYVAFNNPADADVAFGKWLRQSAQRLGGEAHVQGFPLPRQALAIAEDHLRRALAHATGYDRRVATKALLQTLDARRILGDEVDEGQLQALASDALASSDPMQDPARWLQLAARVAAGGGTPPEGPLAAVLAVSLDEWTRRFSAQRAAAIAQAAVTFLRENDPHRALALATQAGPLFSEMPLEQERTAWLETELSLFRAIADPSKTPDAETDLATASEASVARAKDAEQAAAALIALACDAPKLNQEIEALGLVAQAETLAPALAAAHQRALVYLRATLWMGIASNHMLLRNPSEPRRAAGAYTEALVLFLELRCPGRALDILLLLRNLASRKDPSVVPPILLALAHHGLRCERTAGRDAADLICDICRRLTALLVASDSPALLPIVWQVAKGMRWAASLTEGYGLRPGEDDQVQRTLSEIAEARRSAGPDAYLDRYPEGGSPEFEAWLTTYARAERYDGDQDWVRVANLKMTLDQRVADLIAPPEAIGRFEPLDVETLQAGLDAETALLLTYIGKQEDDLPAAYCLLITRETQQPFARGPAFGEAELPMRDGERTGAFSVFAPRVQALRRLIQTAPPDGLVVAAETDGALGETLAYLFGALGEALDTLRSQGKNHLVVAPHDALHFMPFHLLGTSGRPLADQWTVTYLPNLALFARARGHLGESRRRRPDRGASIGLGFAGDPAGWPAIEDAVVEAEDVAQILGQPAILDSAATKPAVREALATCRTVHLASHGAIDVDAPAFQMVVLHPPDSETEGRLFAHEILDLDLAGLEIVTLSACETSLGRVDRSDNLRGLAPALFSAGVATVIGTLWRVSSPAARQFFTSFYRDLKETGRCLDAFRKAQHETRAAFPQYRDWGAFYLQGAWE